MSLHASTGADAVIVFARAPVPGKAKTRLIPRLGAWRAAALQARLTARALRTARKSQCGTIELHVTRRHGLFRKESVVKVQRGGNLGERMFTAFENALRRYRAVVLIGADCPALRPADLRRAARLLRGACDAVLAPAEDGGYALIALKRARRGLFEGIDWGSDSVLRQTLLKMKTLHLSCKLLRTVWDLDRPEDLERLRSLRFS